MRTLMSSIREELNAVSGKGTLKSLAAFGVTSAQDGGALSLDDKKWDKVFGEVMPRAQANIANMALSRNKETKTAVTVIEVDTEPPAELLEKLRATPGIIRVLSFEL